MLVKQALRGSDLDDAPLQAYTRGCTAPALITEHRRATATMGFLMSMRTDYSEASADWFESRLETRLAQEHEHTIALITDVVRDLLHDLDKAIVDVRLAAKVQDGRDGRGFNVRGTWNANERYFALDTVALNGSSFAARRDNPGECPGDGWQMIACQGKRGPIGPKGDTGDRGPAGIDAQTIVAWGVDDENYTVRPKFADGTFGPVLELRKLFERFLEDTAA
jgi:hypothetical protein